MNSFKPKIKNLGLVLLSLLVTCFSPKMYAYTPLTFVYSFTGANTNGNGTGAYPYSTLVQGDDGWFYGTTSELGPNPTPPTFSNGTVFRVNTSGTFQTLYGFPGTFYSGTFTADCPYGMSPMGGLVQGSDGNFYGTTYWAGANEQDANGISGTVFEIGTNGNLTTLWNFTGGLDGGGPSSTLVQGSDGYLYGTTSGYAGGSTQISSTIFKIYPSPSTTSITTLYTFTGGSDGYWPSELVQGSDGNFYGTTAEGGQYGYGTVFKMTSGGTLTTLHSFNSSDGSMVPLGGSEAPRGNGLVQGSDGYFYGITSGGGSIGSGTVFRFNSTNNSLITLYDFSGYFDGGAPVGKLVQGSDGNFYGECNFGGWITGGGSGAGTVFVVTPNGHLITLYAFAGADGQEPETGLIQGSDGNLYGTTGFGGTGAINGNRYSSGTVFGILPVGHRWGITNTVTVGGSWTCPANIYYGTIECWSAGGGGSSTTTFNASGGGGGGAYSKGNLVQMQPYYAYTSLVGAGGAADNAGGNTAFPSSSPLVEAIGGSAGTLTTGGQGGQASLGIGDTRYSGGSGGNGTAGSQYTPYWSGPGGGAAGSIGNGANAPANYSSNGGTGTSSYGGNGGDSWKWLYFNIIANTATAGGSYGGGGAGALSTSYPATSGADGFMRISY